MPAAVTTTADETAPTAAPRRLPAYYIGHAGVGLLFRDDDAGTQTVRRNLAAIGDEIRALSPPPRAILTLSGHFEAGEIHGPGVIEVNVKDQTPILHDFVMDFHDARPEVYKYDWPHADDPVLAGVVWKQLRQAGIAAKRVERGVDHGVWVPFKVLFPPAAPLALPVVQVSTFNGYDLASQLRLGAALAPLRDQGFLIVGSGMAVHSFTSIAEIRDAPDADRAAVRAKVLAESRAFDTAVRRAVAPTDPEARKAALLALEALPEYRRSHPTVEHFTPLVVVAAAAGDSKAEPLGEDVVEPGMSYLNIRFS